MGMIKLTKDTCVLDDNISVVMPYDSVSIKKSTKDVRERTPDKFIDASRHKKVLSIVILKDGTRILTPTSVDTITKRVNG